MSPTSRKSFAITNAVANRVLIPVLKSRAGRRLGRRLTVVEYSGRRSGQHHHLVAQYSRDGSRVHIGVGMSEHKTWWRNFVVAHPLRLRLAGQDYDAVAHVVRANNQVSVVAEIEAGQSS
jgi:hypothetical protein